MQFQPTPSGLSYLTFEQLPVDRLIHGVLLRLGGASARYQDGLNLSSSVPDDPAAVEANRRRAYGAFGRTTGSLVHAHLIHEAHVIVVNQGDQGQVMPGCDGLITADPGCGLTMNYADCAPIVVYDPVRHAAGLGHAGWRGTLADVPGAMVRAMQANFGSHPADLLGAVGPCISAAQYEVGAEVVEQVRARYGDEAEPLLPSFPHKSKRHFDLPAANRLNFERAGVGQVEMAEVCTATRTDWLFSHRAEKGQTGRFGVVVILGE